MSEEKQFLNEVFNLASAKGYDFEVTDMSTVTIPEIRYQCTFEADNGVEYAFRVYKADSMPGRKYGPHSRLLTFMRRKSRNFSQNITVDLGTFKKVLVTFMRCYQDYKENSKDGKKSSSYAVVMQDSLRAYAPLFVRATKRAFRTDKRLQLELMGVNEQGKGNTLELMFKNTQSMYAPFGGKDYDESKFVGNPTHVELAKIFGKDLEQSTVIAKVDHTPVSSVKPEYDRLNPDGIPGLNDEEQFKSDEFILEAFTANGRDALESVFKKYKIHRRYFAEHIAQAVEYWKVQVVNTTDYDDVNIDGVIEGVGFYINRDYNAFMPKFISKLVEISNNVKGEQVKKYIDTYKITHPNNETKLKGRLIDEFIENNINPISDNFKNNYQTMEYVFDNLAIRFVHYQIAKRIQTITDDVDRISAIIAVGTIDKYSAFPVDRISEFGYVTKIDDQLVLEPDVYDKVTSILNRIGVNSKYPIKKKEVVDLSSDFADIKGLIVNGQSRELFSLLSVKYELNVKSDDSYANLKSIEKSLSEWTTDVSTQVIAIARDVVNLNTNELLTLNVLAIATSYLRGRKFSLDNALIVLNDPFFRRTDYGDFYEVVLQGSVKDVNDLIKLIQFFVDNSVYTTSVQESAITDYVLNNINMSSNDAFRLFNYLIGEPLAGNYSASNFTTSIGFKLAPLFSLMSADEFIKLIDQASKVATKYYNKYRVISLGLSKHVSSSVYKDVLSQMIELSKDEYRLKNALTSIFGMVDDFKNDSDDGVEKLAFTYKKFNEIYHFDTDILQKLSKSISVSSLYGGIDSVRQHLTDDEISAIIQSNVIHLRYVSDDMEFDNNVDGRFVDDIVTGMLNDTNRYFEAKTDWRGKEAPNENIPYVLERFDSSMINKLSKRGVDGLKEVFGRVRATSTTKRTIYQPLLDKMSSVLSEADVSDKPQLAQELLDVLDDRERRLLVKSVGKNLFLNKYISAFRDESKIKMNINLNHRTVASILNFNNIPIAKLPNISEKDTIVTAKKKVNKVDINVPEERVEKIDLSEDELIDLTVEYDAFNRKKHNLSLVITEAFKVSIPSQTEGRAKWDAKMQEEGVQSKIMEPVFHGTGSVAAAMILRLGFAVSSLKDTEKTGVKVAGRMLGDGIYFSTAIDKVAQYASDGGFGRRLGAEGYIFEMNASLGKHRRDFREAGTSSQYSERYVVSPEWAVFSPNEQLVINKAYKIKRVPHHVLDKLKSSRKLVNESKNVTGIRGFRDVIRENLNYGTENMITFIFSDGRIPLADGTLIDFDKYNQELGPNVRVEGGQLGAMVTFLDVPDDMMTEDGVDIYHIELSGAFVDVDGDDLFQKYKTLAS